MGQVPTKWQNELFVLKMKDISYTKHISNHRNLNYMKKNYFILLVASLFLVQGVAQEVVQKQRSLLTKRTADWCPNCGTYGWTYFKAAIEQNGNKAIYIAAHYDGNLKDAAAEEITDNFGAFYQPKFFINEIEQGVNSGNVNAKLEVLKTQVDAAFEEMPEVNCGFEPIYENGAFNVAAKVKFFQAMQGDFYLGIYLLEDHVTAPQASVGANAVHRHLFRKSFTAETFGKSIINGSVTAGQTFDLDFALTVPDTTNHEYEVIGIIWEKVGDKYIPANVWQPGLDETVSSVFNPAPQNSILVFPTVTSQVANISVESIENQSVAQLEVFDLTGRRVAVLLNGQLNAGMSNFQLDRETVGGNGLYFVQLKTPGFVKTAKVIFQ